MDYRKKLLIDLKSKGFRPSGMRLAILEEMELAAKPLPVAELRAALRSRGMNPHKTSVYRALKFMMAEGLVRKVNFGEKQDRFELAARHHHHAVCERCGGIEDIDCSSGIMETVETLAARDFLVSRHLVEFIGVCRNCQA